MQAWEQFLQHQEDELGQETVQKWLRNLKILRFDACNLYLEARDSFQILWFEEHIRKKAISKLLNGNLKKIKVHLSLANAPPTAEKKPKEKTKKKETSHFQLLFDELNPLSTFENYIYYPENELPYTLLADLGEKSQTAKTSFLGNFNPIYIHGGSGSGKTHLLMSVAQNLKAKGLKTIYTRGEAFTDHVVSAIRAGEMSTFRDSYRNIDALLVDDVHIFSRKGATQEEFFHTFNTLHLEGKQIILSANCAPQDLQFIEPRLISRFEWGIVLPVPPFPKEKMPDLLKLKIKALNFSLPSKIEEFLIDTFASNPKNLIRALEALILRLHLDSQHQTTNISVSMVKGLLNDLIIEEQKSALTHSKIIQIISEHFGIRMEDILGKAQSRECSLPRQLAMYICRHQLKYPYMKIGDLFSRDHSTVMASIKQIQNALDTDDQDVAGSYYSIIKKFQ